MTWQVVRTVVGLWLVSRLALALVSLVGGALLRPVVPQMNGAPPTAETPFALTAVLSRWMFWDASWYLHIARYGYIRPASAALFPLLPLLERGILLLSGGGDPHVLQALALVLANLLCLAALLMLALLALDLSGSVAVATLTAALLITSPFGFFLSAPYTEALFVALTCGVFLALRRQRILVAVICVALACITRPTGVVLLLVLVVALAQRVTWRKSAWRARLLASLRILALVTAASLPLLAWLLVLRAHYGTPLPWMDAQRRDFGHQGLWPWATVALIAHQVRLTAGSAFASTRLFLDIVPAVATLLLSAVALRRGAWPQRIYLTGALVLMFSAPVVGTQFPDALISTGRYALTLVPLWLWLGRWAAGRPQLTQGLVLLGAMLQAILVTVVLTGGWLV